MTAVDDDTRWARPVFEVAGTTYTWSDVADFARLSNAWDDLRREVLEGVALERRLPPPPADEVRAAAAAFRYERRLISGDDTVAWLRARAIDTSAWMAYVRRSVLRASAANHSEDVSAAPAEEDLLPLLWDHGRCGGALDRMARDLAAAAAVHARATGEAPRDARAADVALQRFREEAVDTREERSIVTARQLDWLAVTLAAATFDRESAAREAALSVRRDGVTLPEVCAIAGVAVRTATALLEEVEEPLRAPVLATPEGSHLGPVPVGDGFVVARVDEKRPPDVDNPVIRRRARDLAVERAVQHEVQARVRWHDGE